jgi:uncharacterized protein (TIGR03437 family)
MSRKLTLVLISWMLLAGHAPQLRSEAVWANGQAARAVIGQPHFTRQNPAQTAETIGAASGVAVAGDRLIIVDGNRIGALTNNNRILIYNNLSSFLPQPEDELPQSGICPVCVGAPSVVLGQADFTSFDPSLTNGVQTPTAVASDGVRLAVADTNNNRVLIWNTIPAVNGTAPNVVVGQPDFQTGTPATTQTGMRGPQGVWIANNRLFVADTQNGRVLIYNSIPSSNGAAADIVLGQPDFTTRPEPDLTQSNVQPTQAGMLDPIAVTVNNGRLFVTDLAFNRVMIYLTIPTQNSFPADVVVGQPDFESALANNAPELCPALPDDGDDETEEPRYPTRCNRTLSFPRFALSDGTRLYIADGGNDRIVIFNQIPLTNGATPNYVLGQADFDNIEESDGAATLRSPTSLAHDGKNLYVADPFSRRVLVFTPGEDMILQDGLRNAASVIVTAQGSVTFDGTVEAGPQVGVTINEKEYIYTAVAGDTTETIRDRVMALIAEDPDAVVTVSPFLGAGVSASGTIKFGGATRAGDVIRLQVADQVYEITVQAEDSVTDMVDIFTFFMRQRPDPNVFAERLPSDIDTLWFTARNAGPGGNQISMSITGPQDTPLTFDVSGETLVGGSVPYGMRIVAKVPGVEGNEITLTTNPAGNITVTGSGSLLTGGGDARELPAGTLATIFGTGMSDVVVPAQLVDGHLPTEINGVRVYANGVLAPLYYVGPDQINFQVPYEVAGTSVSAYIWRKTAQGVTVSAPRAATVTRASPGLFANPGPEPRQAIAVHAAGPAQGTVGITSTAGGFGDTETNLGAGVTGSITINGRVYSYTTVDGDTALIVREQLLALINAGAGDPDVIATPDQEGFFSARATVAFAGEIQVGDSVTITIRDRPYTQVVVEGDTFGAFTNKFVQQINSGLGDPEVEARRLQNVGLFDLQVVARSIGIEGNDIPFTVSVSANAKITATTEEDEGTLEGGQTPPVVKLTARIPGREGNNITYSATSSDEATLAVSPRSTSLCCGNEPFSLITDENPAVPGETIVVFGSGLGLTAPLPAAEELASGEVTPLDPLFNVPAVADDFVASQAAGRTATVEFVGLMPGAVGVYQINLRLNTDIADTPAAPLTIFQRFFVSNVVTIPIRNIRPRPDLQ